MSERYGDCKLCKGEGTIPHEEENGEMVQNECPRCDGSGHNGDATDAP